MKRSASRFVILRLGHVYGPGQGHSEAILGEILDPSFSLPFGGRQPANAIHVARLAHLVASIASSRDIPSGTYNSFDAPTSTWKDVFDLHAGAAGASPVRHMDDSTANRHLNDFIRNARTSRMARLLAEACRAIRVAAVRFALESQDVKEIGHAVLLRLPARMEDFIRRTYNRSNARSQIASLIDIVPGTRPVSPWYYWTAAPGPNLLENFAATIPSSNIDLKEELRVWQAKRLGLA